MKKLSISSSMVPSQRHTEQGCVNRGEFGPNDWKFDIMRTPKLDWAPDVALYSDCNYFTKTEAHQKLKTMMFNQPTGNSPIYGHTNYFLNPLDQSQTNSHMSAYKGQEVTRVADNTSPAYVMHAPAYQYPITSGPSPWINNYISSRTR